MSRRIFSEYGFSAAGHVLPYENFIPFTDRGDGQPSGLLISDVNRAEIIRRAEALLGKQYPPLLASDYMMFRRDGNRSVYEDKYFPRRRDLMILTAAEYAEGQGRFLDAVIDLTWMIMEESSWVLPAHNLVASGDTGALTYAVTKEYAHEVDYIDLFAAATGADLAFVWYLLREPLGKASAAIPARILFELQRRIIRPVIDRANHGKMFWLGIGRAVNNWCPWIISNLLTVTALVETDLSVREDMVTICLAGLDTFTSMYKPDGGCDEGPSYWGVAGGALFSALEVLYDLTGGYVNVWNDPLIRRMGEYIVKAHVTGCRFLNFADAPAKMDAKQVWGYEWGQRCGSDVMTDFFRHRINGASAMPSFEANLPYRSFHSLALDPLPPLPDYRPPHLVWLDDLVIAASREIGADGQTLPEGQGLYLALKGGHNGEGHNHNDVGTVIVFSGDKPVFLDAGSGTYTRRTFSPRRYEIWAMCSDWHNTVTFNGSTQPDGGRTRSQDHVYDPETGALSMELSAAYRPSAGLASWTRKTELAGHTAVVTDTVTLRDTNGQGLPVASGTVMFSFMTDKAPEKTGKGYFFLHDCVVKYDPALTLRVEAASVCDPETENIPERWDVDTLWRVTLTDEGCPAGTERTYVLTVEDRKTADPDGALYALRPDCRPYLGKTVLMKTDRPIGYVHEKNGHTFTYPINYGYIENAFGGDDEELDVYLMGVTETVTEYRGRIVGIVMRTDDEEDKLVMAPEGVTYTAAEIAAAVAFQEQYHESYIVTV
ncbi:MAG: heparinase II/III family protein [Clostridia bacterium]|nr:heparinase II/III family protein [Clostridia bacterium]